MSTTGCVRSNLRHEDVVGVYRTKPSASDQSGVIIFEFSDNGRFVGRDVPNFFFYPHSGLELKERQDIVGSWSIASDMIFPFVLAGADLPTSGGARFKHAFRYSQKVLVLLDTPEDIVFYKEPNPK